MESGTFKRQRAEVLKEKNFLFVPLLEQCPMLNTLQPLTNSLKNTNFVKRNSKYTLSKYCYWFLTIKIYITQYYLRKYRLVFSQKHFCDTPLESLRKRILLSKSPETYVYKFIQ